MTEAKVEEAVAKETAAKKEKEDPNPEKKPMFHFEGDENFVDSEEEEEEEGDEEEEEEEDDLGTAFEILDLARVLFTQKLEALQAEPKPSPEGEASEEKGKEAATTTTEGEANGLSPAVKHIKERLGDTHDLLAEISLENER